MKQLAGQLSPNTEVVHTYGCNICRDQGLLLEERETRIGYEAVYSKPCPTCKYGEEMLAGDRKAIIDSVSTRLVRPRNQKLRYVDVEVEDA